MSVATVTAPEDTFVCPADHKHGETATCSTAHGCRCDECREAHRDYQLWWRGMHRAGRTHVFDGVVDATGTRRRIQALARLGWSQSEIARRYGIAQELVSAWTLRARVRVSSARLVAQIFEEMSTLIPPTDTTFQRISVNRTRALAERRGWPPPLAWDDIDNDPAPAEVEPDPALVDVVVVDLALLGDKPRKLTPEERRIVVDKLTRQDPETYSAARLALLLSVEPKTIERDRATLAQEAAALAEASSATLPEEAAA